MRGIAVRSNVDANGECVGGQRQRDKEDGFSHVGLFTQFRGHSLTRTLFPELDEQLEQIFKALHQLISPPLRPKRPVGFRVREEAQP